MGRGLARSLLAVQGGRARQGRGALCARRARGVLLPLSFFCLKQTLNLSPSGPEAGRPHEGTTPRSATSPGCWRAGCPARRSRLGAPPRPRPPSSGLGKRGGGEMCVRFVPGRKKECVRFVLEDGSGGN